MDPITYPLRSFARDQKVSPQRLYDLIDNGEIESVLIGNRRHIVVASYYRMIERRRAEQEGAKLPSSNPKAKAHQKPAVPRTIQRPQSTAQSRQQYRNSRRS